MNAEGVKRYMKGRLEDLRFRLVCFQGDNVECGMVYGTSRKDGREGEGSVIGLHYFWN